MTKHPGGRPSSFRPEFVEQAKKLCALGATDEDLADFFGVAIRTISNWKSYQPEFLQALKGGKDEADDRVERSLYQKATGYTYDAIHFSSFQGVVTATPYREHVPPDTTAMIFWLKNRRPDLWRDKTEQVIRHEVAQLGDDELARIAASSGNGTSPKKGNSPQLN
ncbi:TPA: hypothetical protein O5T86_001258 [Staphylococcus aureus]|nr:hypothetical protein [Staphylococcus aureus]HDA7217715.1 hypothetical protein [Staphylococcus aureus]HDA7234760.1 hypothetical protein [Staphylococcus aureus]HDA7239222.1 hypothetical protein [Staphylococcus aureus]HDA7241903.1 hypothetical protein [Staphylococcus aureus]